MYKEFPNEKVFVTPALEMQLGRIYKAVLEFSSVADGSTWYDVELVRVEDGIYRRFIDNSEDNYKLYITYRPKSYDEEKIYLLK